MFWKLTLLFILFFLFSNIKVFSIISGEISGKVIDGETGEVLRRASILVLSSKNGGYSDVKGEFKIRNIEPGIYKIKISYIGYVTKYIDKIQVESGKMTKVGEVILSVDKKTTEDVLVEVKRINDNESAMLSERKNSSQVSDGISQEQMSRLPDSDAGQSLKRISGITLVNDKFIFVRGVSERYSNTIINGTSLATTEPDKKAFSFDIFPSEFLQNAIISKSFTPDLPGNFAGGLVQLNTIDFPSGMKFKLKIGTSMTDNVTMKSSTFMIDNGGSADWLGFDDGSRSMPKDMPGSPLEMKQLLYDLKNSNDDVKWKAAYQQWQALNQEYNSTLWKRDTISAPPNQNYSITYSDLLNIAGNDFGIIASFLSNNAYTYNSIERGRFDATVTNYDYFGTGSQSIYSTNLGGMLNLAYKIGGNTSITWQNTYNNSSDDETDIIEGYINDKNNKIRQYGYQFVQKTLISSQLGGEHTLAFINNSLLNWKLGISKSQRNEPDFGRVRYFKNGADANDNYKLDIYDNNGVGNLAGRYNSLLNETALSGKMDLTIPINENFKIKTGSLFENKNRDFNVRSFTITFSKKLVPNYFDPDFGYFVPNYGDDEFFDKNLYEEPFLLFDKSNFNVNRLGFSEETNPSDSYKADESLQAFYAMSDLSFYLASNKIRFIGGLRIENSNQKLYSFYPIGFNNTDTVFVDNNYLDLLPAISLIYEVNKEMNLRFSATQTLTRPSLREYAPFTFYDYNFQCDVTGNIHLQRSLIQNYDLRWEFYPNPGEMISIGVFYKIFQNAIEETLIPTTSNGIKTWKNANGNAYNYGIELELRKQLNFISDFTKDFFFNLNFAVINSTIEVDQGGSIDKRSMWGQSPYTLNVGLFYHNPEWGTTANLGYNINGRRIIEVVDIMKNTSNDPHVYEMPRNVIDLSLSQVIGKFEIKFLAKDLLNEKLIWEQVGKTVSSDYKGRGFSLSFSYNL
jgi:TonB-dependent receptor